MDKDILWKQVLDVVRVSVSSANFSTWFGQTFLSNIKIVDEKSQIVEIGCISSFTRDILERRYSGLLQDALNQVTDKKNTPIFVIKTQPVVNANTSTPPLFAQNEVLSQNDLRRARIPSGFNFDNFAVSPANQLAYAAARAVTQNPGKIYNPLFIWGGVGVGKTHLAIATAVEIITRFPDKKVLYSTGDEFIVGIIDAIRTKTTADFKKKYRGVDILVVDDIGFIAGKDTVQDEFFHTYNQIKREGGQVILTSDRPPYDIPKLEDRLRSRFEAGLIVDIAPPDFELRVAILLIKAKEMGINLPIELAQKIAEDIITARQIEGFLNKITSRLEHQNLELSEILVKELVDQEKPRPNGHPRNHITIKDIVHCVVDYFSLNNKQLTGSSRKKTLVVPRHILMYILRTELNLPYEEIGRVLGNRDHTTIMHGVQKIEQQIINNNELQRDILGIKSRLWG